MSLTNNKSDRLYRRVADELADAIRKGTYVPGDKLPPERELAESFGVSRPTVREAMIALEIYGVVEIRHGSGIYVVAPERGDGTPPAREDLNVGAFELIEARIIIEGETAAVAAAGVGDADVARLETLIERMRTGDEAECEQADREFHSHLAGITENSALIDTIEHMWDLRTRSPLASQIMSRAQGGGRAARIQEHEAIVAALKKHDPAAARAAMRYHLEQVREYLLVATETAELESLRQKLRAQRDVLSRRTGY
jgi:GntR family transcriptional repressor for pyruvate dehydrogenase complex